MTTKLAKMGALGGMHTAGIFSDMTVDGPEIGTLVAVVDRAKNLPNRRTMGKQDPYCAARLGKEAKKTETDKRGGQTPRWDQELRFTVHDSPDYYQLKVSVFNDDKKTELIGEVWINLENVITPGGGQSDTWHGLNCKGKYAGEIRIELTYYDTRPKAEKPAAEKRQETAGSLEQKGASLSGPREHTPVKRRPLPSNPTSAASSPVATPDHRSGHTPQAGPRSYPTPPRQHQHTSSGQRRSYHPDTHSQSVEHRRPLPESSPINVTPTHSFHNTPQHQHRSSRAGEYGTNSPAACPPTTLPAQYASVQDSSFDMSYTAPKPYEVRPIDPLPQHPREVTHGHGRPTNHMELPHSQSAPVVPTQHMPEIESRRRSHYPSHSEDYGAPQLQDDYQQPPVHYQDYRSSPQLNQYELPIGYEEPHHFQSQELHPRPFNTMQPTVEDEDDAPPPPPPVHRSSAPAGVPQLPQQPPNYPDDAPAPLNVNRYRDQPPQPPTYGTSPRSYQGMSDYAVVPHSSERRYTHPRPALPPSVQQPPSRPISRDEMVPSPLRQETSAMPSSLIAGYNTSVSDELHMPEENRMVLSRGDPRDYPAYQAPPSYETPPRHRHHSEPDYPPPNYATPPEPQALVRQGAFAVSQSPSYYPQLPHEPHEILSYHDTPPMIKPRATSPGLTNNPSSMDNRASRGPARSTPTRKSVSPRPPPSGSDPGERRLSGVPFSPDSFDALNPTMSRSPNPNTSSFDKTDERRASNVEINDKGQVVTFSGRVIDASDHLPLDSWAPEPEPKGQQKDRPARERVGLNGARDIEAARQRERERKERDHIRNAVNATIGAGGSPNSASHNRGYSYSTSSPVPLSYPEQDINPNGRNRLQKRDARRPMSMAAPTTQSNPSNVPAPPSHILRERENVGGYGSSGYGAGARHSIAAPPPIPAKIPMNASDGLGPDDLSALSLELQSIDIGSGRARPRTARRIAY